MIAWYVPRTGTRHGRDASGPAFKGQPSRGTAAEQQDVSGFLGKGLVNTFDPSGDPGLGTLTSPEFELTKKYIHFLVGGGGHAGKTCVELLVDDRAVRSTSKASAPAFVSWTRKPAPGDIFWSTTSS